MSDSVPWSGYRIRALAEALLADPLARRVTLFSSVRTAADAIDRAPFGDWERRHPGFHFLLTLTRDASAPLHRRIPELLPNAFGSLHGFDVFVAGPTDFVTDCAAAARALGAVVRRAEHAAAHLHVDAAHPLNPHVRIYLNRVSDLIFVLARHAAGDREEPLSHTVVDAS